MKLYGVTDKAKWVPVEFRKNGSPIEPQAAVSHYIIQGRPDQLGGKRTHSLKGLNFRTAVERFNTIQANGVTALIADFKKNAPSTATRKTVKDAAADYITAIEKKEADGKLATKSVYAYRQTVSLFAEHSTAVYLDEITAETLTAFEDSLRKVTQKRRGSFQYTLANHFRNLNIFLKKSGIRMSKEKNAEPGDRGLLERCDVPKPPKVEGNQEAVGVRTYLNKDINAMLAVANEDEKDLIMFALKTGFRDGEIAAAEWSDIDWTGEIGQGNIPEGVPSIITQTKEASRSIPKGFRPKGKRSRSVAIQSLIKRLKERHDKRRDENSTLIFPNSNGQFNDHLIDRYLHPVIKNLKKFSKMTPEQVAAELELTLSEAKKLDGYEIAGVPSLHRFRKTFATRLLETGLDVLNVSKQLGHADIAVTLRYLGVNNSAAAAVTATAFSGVGD